MDEPNERHDSGDAGEEPGEGPENRESGPPSEDRVRLELILFSELIQTLAKDDRLLDAVPFLLGRLGDLRRVLFDYEVRGTERLLPIEDPDEREARRLLRRLEERKKEMKEDWEKGWSPPAEDEEGDAA